MDKARHDDTTLDSATALRNPLRLTGNGIRKPSQKDPTSIVVNHDSVLTNDSRDDTQTSTSLLRSQDNASRDDIMCAGRTDAPTCSASEHKERSCHTETPTDKGVDLLEESIRREDSSLQSHVNSTDASTTVKVWSILSGTFPDESMRGVIELGNNHNTDDDESNEEEEKEEEETLHVNSISAWLESKLGRFVGNSGNGGERKIDFLARVKKYYPFLLQLFMIALGGSCLYMFAHEYYYPYPKGIFNASDIPWPDLLIRSLLLYVIYILEIFYNDESPRVMILESVLCFPNYIRDTQSLFRSHEMVLALFFKAITIMSAIPNKATVTITASTGMQNGQIVYGSMEMSKAIASEYLCFCCINWLVTSVWLFIQIALWNGARHPKSMTRGMSSSVWANLILFIFLLVSLFLPTFIAVPKTDNIAMKRLQADQLLGHQTLLVLRFFDALSRNTDRDRSLFVVGGVILVVIRYIAFQRRKFDHPTASVSDANNS